MTPKGAPAPRRNAAATERTDPPPEPADRRPDRSATERTAPTSPLEWVAAGIGALLIAAMIVYMVQYGLREHAEVPGRIDFTVTETQAGSHGHTVRFQIRNRTAATAATLRVRGELRSGDRVVETSEVEFDYLPPYSERFGGLIFQRDPARFELRIFPTGYSEP
ncbi:TIGR02588 family protein [Azospirillum ramasamyi]|uniref:TIGR02588 family protein n=1 Tax=Azospirillum ramasamyi TaxID=682998 RepID=A0A2U9SB77_9PROT|nr:TIGR02588 family protein [Azospirillum ramasamyi]AWU95238.1 TIGR02588 family protein [Azospirillum ramasamyi]